jgi:hypothetical protein
MHRGEQPVTRKESLIPVYTPMQLEWRKVALLVDKREVK